MIKPQTWAGLWLEFKPADLWIGAYYNYERYEFRDGWVFDLWVCLLPCLPLHFQIEKNTLKVAIYYGRMSRTPEGYISFDNCTLIDPKAFEEGLKYERED